MTFISTEGHPTVPGSEARVLQSGRLIYHGPIPPLLDGPGPWGECFPGADLDVKWKIRHDAFGWFFWTQKFRAGQEVDISEEPCASWLRLSTTYEQMLNICYDGMPFESILSEAQILEMFIPLSCLTGLLNAERAPRPGSLTEEQIEAFGAWGRGEL